MGKIIYRKDNFNGLEKQCTKCHEFLPADKEFYFANFKMRDGLQSWCKACCLEYRINNYKEKHGINYGSRSTWRKLSYI